MKPKINSYLIQVFFKSEKDSGFCKDNFLGGKHLGQWERRFAVNTSKVNHFLLTLYYRKVRSERVKQWQLQKRLFVYWFKSSLFSDALILWGKEKNEFGKFVYWKKYLNNLNLDEILWRHQTDTRNSNQSLAAEGRHRPGPSYFTLLLKYVFSPSGHLY